MMENSYGIGVANRYALFLDDESDPLETLNLKEQEKELKKKSKVAEKENKGKTEPAKGKPANVQKKTNKENTIHKVQENKRDGEFRSLDGHFSAHVMLNLKRHFRNRLIAAYFTFCRRQTQPSKVER